MTARHGHFDRAFRVKLAAHIPEIFEPAVRLRSGHVISVPGWIDRACTIDELDNIRQSADRIHRYTFNDGSFSSVSLRYEQKQLLTN